MRLLVTVCILAASLLATAAPWVVSDPVAVGVTQCGVYIDTAPMVTNAVVAGIGGNICRYDLAGMAAGAHWVAMTAITVQDPIWGSQESVKSSPLAFTVPGMSTATAVEYYHVAWGYYFETAFTDEIAGLDGGAYGGVWKRTGETFNVWPQPNASASPTCRFFSTSFAPKSSHFYTPSPAECAVVKTNPNWEFESIAFYIALVDGNGNCPPGTIPLYRFYNNGMGGAPNHRYTTSLVVFNQLTALGWQFEGNANTKVFACVPL